MSTLPHNIPSDKDAYGHAMYDWYMSKGRRGNEVIEREDGWIGVSSGPEIYFTEYAEWPSYLRHAVNFATGRVLDIGAGAGRHALYLQGKGLEVTAIDNSPLAVEVMKKRGVRDARFLGIEEIETFAPETFTTVLMLGNNLGLLGGQNAGRELLKKIHTATSEDAFIIAESRDPKAFTDPEHTAYYEENVKRGKLPGQFTARMRYRNYISDWFDYLYISEADLDILLEGSGWRVAQVLQSEDSTGMYAVILQKLPL